MNLNALSDAAGASSAERPEVARVRLRPTMASDIRYVLSLEQDLVNLPFITPWDAPQHEAAIRFPDMRHFIVEGLDPARGLAAVGFAILIGCRSQHGSIELKRLVIADKSVGFGRSAVRVLKKVAFDEFKAHRFWLDVKSGNPRAKSLYESEGFVAEGVLREAVRVANGYESLHVLSMLQREFVGRRGANLEMRA